MMQTAYSINIGMTVSELIDQLSKLPPDLLVVFYDDWEEKCVVSVDTENVWNGVNDEDNLTVAYIHGKSLHKREGQ